jgi:hypothetical protein
VESTTATTTAAGVVVGDNNQVDASKCDSSSSCCENEMKKFRLGVKRRLYHERSDDLAACGEDKLAIKQTLAALYDDVERGYSYAAKRARQSVPTDDQ